MRAGPTIVCSSTHGWVTSKPGRSSSTGVVVSHRQAPTPMAGSEMAATEVRRSRLPSQRPTGVEGSSRSRLRSHRSASPAPGRATSTDVLNAPAAARSASFGAAASSGKASALCAIRPIPAGAATGASTRPLSEPSTATAPTRSATTVAAPAECSAATASSVRVHSASTGLAATKVSSQSRASTGASYQLNDDVSTGRSCGSPHHRATTSQSGWCARKASANGSGR